MKNVGPAELRGKLVSIVLIARPAASVMMKQIRSTFQTLKVESASKSSVRLIAIATNLSVVIRKRFVRRLFAKQTVIVAQEIIAVVVNVCLDRMLPKRKAVT